MITRTNKSKHQNGAGHHKNTTSELGILAKRDALSDRIESYLQYAEEREEFRAQHGLVRILMKDGKPVG